MFVKVNAFVWGVHKWIYAFKILAFNVPFSPNVFFKAKFKKEKARVKPLLRMRTEACGQRI